MRTLILIFALACALPARAGTSGAEPFNFLFIDANGRPAAMGGAYSALARDAAALHYNPAGLAERRGFEASVMHNQYVAGITQEYLAIASPWGFGLDLNYLNSGAVARTTLSNPDGAGYDTTGLVDMAVGLGYGRRIGPVALGATVRLIHESIAGVSAQGYALDLGSLYAVPWIEGLSLAAGFQNIGIGPTVKFQGSQEELPLNGRFGAAYEFTIQGFRNALSMDIAKERNEAVLVHFGGETIVSDTLALRLGFNNRNTVGTGITFGVGWVRERYSIDYAVATFGRLGLTHRVGASFRWGEGVSAPRAARAAPEPARPTADQRFAAAESALAQRDFERARSELREAARLLGEGDRRRALYFERMGQISWLENDIPKAKGYFIQSLGQARALGLADDSVAQLHAKLGLCWAAESNPAEAVRAFEEGLALPASPSTRQFLLQQLQKHK